VTSDEHGLKAFFDEYATVSFLDSPERHAALYAPNFIAAGPAGSAVFANDLAFVDWLRKVRQFNRQTGMQSVEVVTLGQPAVLSPIQILVKVEWGARFNKTGDRLITFYISYLLERSQDNFWKILAYIDEKDQMTEMRELGLL